jgi:hypothetical protein
MERDAPFLHIIQFECKTKAYCNYSRQDMGKDEWWQNNLDTMQGALIAGQALPAQESRCIFRMNDSDHNAPTNKRVAMPALQLHAGGNSAILQF